MTERVWTPGNWIVSGPYSDTPDHDGYSIDSDTSQVGWVFTDPDGTEDPRRAKADAEVMALSNRMAELLLRMDELPRLKTALTNSIQDEFASLVDAIQEIDNA